MKPLGIAIVAGGPSSEAEVSRTSAKAVFAALSGLGHEARILELDASLPEQLRQGSYDVAFPVTHGTLGEDGGLQGLLEVLRLPYVGSGVLASALASSKPHAKVQMAAAGIPVAASIVVRHADEGGLCERLRAELGPALVVKPASGGSAIGVSCVPADADDAALLAALRAGLAVDEAVLVEQFRAGYEATCGVLEDGEGRPQPLPPTLIVPRRAGFYDFASKYASGGSAHQCPAPFPSATLEQLQRLSVRAHVCLGARDLSRVDFIVSQRQPHELTVLEVNTLPGMTATSLFPEAAAAAGIPFPELCARLVERAVRHSRRDDPAALAMPD